MPNLLVRRDRVVEPVLRLVTILRRLDPDARDETEAVEVAVRPDAARLLCGVALIVGLDAARGFQDGAQYGCGNLSRLGVTWRAAGNGEEHPELALRKVAVEHDELAVERFAAAVLGTAQPAVLAGTTGADGHAHGGDRAVRNHIEIALGCRVIEVVASHGCWSPILLLG